MTIWGGKVNNFRKIPIQDEEGIPISQLVNSVSRGVSLCDAKKQMEIVIELNGLSDQLLLEPGNCYTIHHAGLVHFSWRDRCSVNM